MDGKTSGYGRRIGARGLIALLLAALAVVTLPATTAESQTSFPDVDIFLVAEVYDSVSWLGLHREVLGTPQDSPKVLSLTLPAGTGGNRSLRVDKPKFSVEIIAYAGRRLLKIGVTGKIPASEALRRLPDFEQAALDVQAGVVQNNLLMGYGLSTVTGDFLEMYLGRP